MHPVQPLGQQVQVTVVTAERLEFLDCRKHIVPVLTRNAVALAHVVELLGEPEPAGVLRMAAVDEIANSLHPAFRVREQNHRTHAFTINHGHLFAGAQIIERGFAGGGRDPIGDAAAHSAEIETQHQSGPFRAAAMHVRPHAQGSMGANEPRRHPPACVKPHRPARQGFRAGNQPMIHPELAPSRSRWVVAPFLAVLVLAALWTGFWLYASSTAQATLTQWREQEARLGRTYTCGSQSTGGYPFRLEVRCADPPVEMRAFQPALLIAARSFLVAAQVYDPSLLIGEITGPLTITEAGGREALVASWRLAQIRASGRPNAPERVSIAADDLRIDRGREGGPRLASAAHLELHGRADPSSVATKRDVV